jgi:hypothetical protein
MVCGCAGFPGFTFRGLGPTRNRPSLSSGKHTASGEVPESGFTALLSRSCVRRSAESGCWRAYARQQRILTSRRRHLKPHMHGRSSHTHGPMTLQVRCRCHHGFTMRAQWLPRPRGKAPTRHMNHATNNRRGVCIAPSLRTPKIASCAERGTSADPAWVTQTPASRSPLHHGPPERHPSA